MFGLYRWEMTGDRGGAAPHIHRSFSESFYVLSGIPREQYFEGLASLGTLGDDEREAFFRGHDNLYVDP